MGTYDEFFFYCPVCGETIEIHSKMGPCNMGHYDMSSAPLAILADVEEDGPYTCPACDTRWNLSVATSVSVLQAPDEDQKGDD